MVTHLREQERDKMSTDNGFVDVSFFSQFSWCCYCFLTKGSYASQDDMECRDKEILTESCWILVAVKSWWVVVRNSIYLSLGLSIYQPIIYL